MTRVAHIRPGLSLLHKIVLAVTLFITASCSKLTGSDAFVDSQTYTFPGLSEVKANGNGTYTLKWQRVPASDVTYYVFSRSTGEDYNFSSPVKSLKEVTWQTDDMTFVSNTCFVVRFDTPDIHDDTNTTEKCTDHDAVTFQGLDSIAINSDGSLSLKWTKIPQDGVLYLVFRTESPGHYDLASSNAWNTVTDVSTLDVSKYALDKKYCYLVRYSKVGAPEDSNTKEICPDLAYANFDGIAAATSPDTGVAQISWTPSDNSNVVGYNIYQGDNLNILATSAAADATSVLVSNLLPDSTYTFGVRAVDKYKREDSNAVVKSIKISNNLAPVFSGLTSAVQATASSVTLNWLTASGGPKSYHVYMSSGASGSTPSISYNTATANVDVPATSYTVSGLGDDMTYVFAVRAASSGGQEDSNTMTKTVTLPDAGAPSFDGLKTVSFGSGTANLTWNEAVGQTSSYKVYYQLGSTLNWNTATQVTVTAPATSYSIAGLPDNSTYVFGVRALDSHNQLDTNTVTKTATSGDLTPPTFQGFVSLTALNETQIQVVVNRSSESDVSYYSIQYRKNGTSDSFVEGVRADQVSSGNVTATLSSLLPATSYDVLVKVYDTSGNPSTNSSYQSRTTLDLTAPQFSGATSAVSKPGDVTQVRLSWNAATDSGGLFEYRVYYSTQSLLGQTLVRTATYPLTVGAQTIYMSTSVSSSATSADISGLSSNTAYFFIVHAVDSAGNEDANASQASFTVPDFTPPAVVSGLAFSPSPGSGTNNKTPYITGTGIAGNTARVYVNNALSASGQIPSNGNFSVQISLPNTSGTYVVTATQANLNGVESSPASVGSYPLQVDPPTATLTGAPSGYVSTNAVNVTVGGANASEYRFAIVGSGTDCANAGYGSWTAIATPIATTVSSNGAYKICVEARDAIGNEQTGANATTSTWTFDNVAPSAPPTLTNQPTGTSGASSVDITVGGTDIYEYKYVFTTQSATPTCDATHPASGWSNWTQVATHISGSPGADGNIRLCIVGRDQAQNLTTYTNADWTKLSAPPTITSVVAKDKTTNSTTMTNVAVVSVTGTGSATAQDWCYKTTNSTPGALDGCWGTATQQITLPSSGSNTIYAWVRDSLGNIQSTPSSATITWTNYCDSGNFDGVCTISSSHTIPNGTALGGEGSLVVASGGNLNAAAGSILTLTLPTGNVTVNNGGTIAANFSTFSAVNVQIDAGGFLKADALGYTAVMGGDGNGQNGGGGKKCSICGASDSPSGGGHGGAGGYGLLSVAGGASYGSLTQPTTFGSAGGSYSSTYIGGNGGGAIKIVASGTLTVNGTLSANGQDGTSYAAGGAGGSLWLSASGYSGSGTISAKGGAGVEGYYCAGSGGGGRIAFYNGNRFTGTIDVSSTEPPTNTYCRAEHFAQTVGENGTVYIDSSVSICDTGTLSDTCTISTPLVLSDGYAISGSGNLTISSTGSISLNRKRNTFSINMGGNFSLASGATITGNISELTANNISIDGTITANGQGFRGAYVQENCSTANCGTGVGATDTYGGGGSHGGAGGKSVSGIASGGTYGTASAPVTYGSGGGGSSYTPGQAGGGIVKIVANGTLSINGTVSADGLDAPYSVAGTPAGGGAGGSIWIQSTGAMSGTGTISARGGDGNQYQYTYQSGAGGGGRISISGPNAIGTVVSVGPGPTFRGGAQYGSLYTNYSTICDSGSLNGGVCNVTSNIWLADGTSISGTSDLVVSGSIHALPKTSLSISMHDITVQTGASILANLSLLSANNLTIALNATVSAEGMGYLAAPDLAGEGGNISGGGDSAAYKGGGGGGHGGAGGAGYSTGTAGVAYDSANKLTPTTWGGAGGSAFTWQCTGGAGGGAVKISVTSALTVDGTLSASGANASNACTTGSFAGGGGGGAGGSLWVTTNSLAGSGSILAKGGNGSGVSYSGGGGGGGLLSLTYSSTTFSGTPSAAKGTAYTGNGGNGTDGLVCTNGAGC